MAKNVIKAAALTCLAGLVLAACSTGGNSGNNNSSSGNGTIKAGPGVDVKSKTITLGVLTPLSGPAALIGKPLTAGQQAYFSYLNSRGGISGWKVNLDIKDDQYNPQLHVQDYNQIISNVAFIAQSLGSPTTQAIETQAQQSDVLLGTAAQSSAFVSPSINAVIGTPYAIDVANALYYLTHTLGKTHAKVGIVYQNDAYGADGMKGYLAAKAADHFDDVGARVLCGHRHVIQLAGPRDEERRRPVRSRHRHPHRCGDAHRHCRSDRLPPAMDFAGAGLVGVPDDIDRSRERQGHAGREGHGGRVGSGLRGSLGRHQRPRHGPVPRYPEAVQPDAGPGRLLHVWLLHGGDGGQTPG